MHFVRIYADAEGESHFEEVSLPTERRPSPVSTAESELAEAIETSELVFRRVVVDHPPDRAHLAPYRQFVVQVAGESEVQTSDGEVRRFGPGSVVLVDDLVGKGHITRRVGVVPRETLMLKLPETAG